MWGSDTETVTRPGYLAGFTTLDSELELDSLEVEGSVPGWLSGSLIRNGPGRFEVGETPLRHWFDGLAMLHRFSFERGGVSYANRFLRSKAHRESERGRLAYREFATDPPRSLLRRASTVLRPPLTDNCSFNIARIGEEYIAMTEAPTPIAFDARTLEALGPAQPAPGHHATAHPHRDRVLGETLSLATRFGPRCRYRIFAHGRRRRRQIVADLPTREPSYMHSFGLTDRHILLTACPFVANPLQLGLSGRPFIENFRWQPQRPTRFLVIDRRTGELRGSFETDPFLVFHHVNVFERGRELVVDLIAYDSPAVIDSLFLDELRAAPPPAAVHGRLRRYRIDLESGAVAGEELCAEMLELPGIDYDRCNGRPYRYVYATSVDTDTGGEPTDFLDRIAKVDVEGGEVAIWQEPGSYPGEPVFVPSPRPGREEDEGVLLTVVLDARGARSYLLILDAHSLEELARAHVPHHIPFGFHGQYFD